MRRRGPPHAAPTRPPQRESRARTCMQQLWRSPRPRRPSAPSWGRAAARWRPQAAASRRRRRVRLACAARECADAHAALPRSRGRATFAALCCCPATPAGAPRRAPPCVLWGKRLSPPRCAAPQRPRALVQGQARRRRRRAEPRHDAVQALQPRGTCCARSTPHACALTRHRAPAAPDDDNGHAARPRQSQTCAAGRTRAACRRGGHDRDAGDSRRCAQSTQAVRCCVASAASLRHVAARHR